ncbi:caspase-3-like [Paramacrobiotus metropolitanus]|uniref:caspase-3-like n=1 Tax=Paramacrobiotus metropolitanus TaxID=2943436 RepID=UPI002445C0DA|nr:caspase-3-like [Paramacrobiotus metropolitanus]XP_055344095.1 caspase-3-like [Paramacrobiotus metropolitanus]
MERILVEAAHLHLMSAPSDEADALGTWAKSLRSSITGLPSPHPAKDALSTPSPDRRASYVPLPPTPDRRYDMSHESRGVALIINNKAFNEELDLGYRAGSDVDAKTLADLFKTLKFKEENIHSYDDLSTAHMLAAMRHFAEQNYDNMDCFVCAILTHGKEGVVFGKEGVITLEALMEPFKNSRNQSLVGKPKIFLVQACRGSRFDGGVEAMESRMEADAPVKVALEADFLYAFSSSPGYFSWRNSARGSWFVQALGKVIKENVERLHEIDLLRILTRVNYEVAYGFESNVPGDALKHRKKQMPSVVSMLTKELYFA